MALPEAPGWVVWQAPISKEEPRVSAHEGQEGTRTNPVCVNSVVSGGAGQLGITY